MASPQKENGYTPIANEIMEALIKYPLPGSQMQCLLLIIRKTYGFNKLTDSISLTQFVEWTGINRNAVVRALNNLVKRNMVYKDKGGIKSDTIITSKYRFNKHYKSWLSSLKSDTGSIKPALKVVSNLRHTKDTIQKTKEKYIKEIRLGIFKISVCIPENYSIQPEHIEYAKKKELSEKDTNEEFERFKTHHQMKGTKYKNWYAGFQKWVQNKIKWQKENNREDKPWKIS